MAEQQLLESLKGFQDKGDFAGAFELVRGNQAEFEKAIGGAGVRDALKKATADRLLLSFVDGVEFGQLPLDKALVRLEKLISFEKGALVIAKAWGLGKVASLDYFYRRVTVDFKNRKGHQFSYAAATDMLTLAPQDHILVIRQGDPARVEMMLKDRPGDFVKEMLKSYGDMPLVRLEELCVVNGFVKSVNWKKFWDAARTELKKDACVVIPARRADSIQLKAAAEDYGGGWLTAFAGETDAKLILAAVRDFDGEGRFKTANEETKAKIGERLAFAVTAARNVDDALYARLACEIAELGYLTPTAEAMRGYLWDRRRYIKAAAALPAREVGSMIKFLAADDEAKARLYKALPEFCFTAVAEIVSRFGAEPACRAAVGALMKEAKAPATLTTLLVGKIEQFGKFEHADVNVDGKKIRVLKSYELWSELPSLLTLLQHAVALGEGRQTGETLKMQNLVRRLFADIKWLEKMLKMLSPSEQVVFFERFQASIAWDPSTHHATVIRMMKIVPALESHIVKVEKKKEYARITSYRSFAFKKQDYLKLINEEMPANVKRIEFAKGFGDLSENAEYQYAKDEQRALMQKQALMQADLESVKPADFADATTDEVMPGVTVVVTTGGGEKTYHVLGEWDNDIELGILSSKTRLAENMLGKKPGDRFEMSAGDGSVSEATIKAILPLPAEIREWMKLPVGMAI